MPQSLAATDIDVTVWLINTHRQLLKFTVQIECNLYNKVWQPFLRHNFSVATSAAWRAPVGNQTARKSHHII
jgi:hypothetical protein